MKRFLAGRTRRGPPGAGGQGRAKRGGAPRAAGRGAGQSGRRAGRAALRVDPAPARPYNGRVGVSGDFGARRIDGFEAIPAVPAEAPLAASAASPGWAHLRAPHGRILPAGNLRAIDEDALLRPGKKAALYAIADGPGGYRPDREPLILVHGIQGHPADLQALADRFRADPRYQLYVLCYDDYNRRTSLNGADFAEELRSLVRAGALPPDRAATIVAHSMGGIVARRALNDLAIGAGRGIECFGPLRLVAIDTPWHGYGGPSDAGAGGFFMRFARPFLPDGLEDMRAESTLFRGDPSASDPAARAPLLEPILPANIAIDLVFAAEGGDIQDYTEGPLAELPQKIADYHRDELRHPIRGDARLMNFWRAIISSSRYVAFQSDLEEIDRRGRLDAAAVRAALARHFPRFPGDHSGVLGPQPAGGALLDWLPRALAATRAPSPAPP